MRLSWILSILILLFGVMVVLLCCKKSHAATMTTRCVVGNKDCFILKVGGDGLSAADRMSLVNDRLAGVLGVAKAKDVHVQETSYGDTAVLIGHTLVVTATSNDSVVNGGRSTRSLATFWAKNLSSALR